MHTHTNNTKFSLQLFLSLGFNAIFFFIAGRLQIDVFFVGCFGWFFFVVLIIVVVDRTSMSDDSRYDAITRNVCDGPTSVHKPINGKDVCESIGCTGPTKYVIVCRDDQNKTSRWYRSRTDTTHSGDDDEQEKVCGGNILSV